MELKLLSPDSADAPPGFGARVVRRDTNDSIQREDESYGTRVSRRDSDQHAPDSPPEPYDPPDSQRHNDVDIPMQQMGQARWSATTAPVSPPMMKNGDYGFINNSTFDSDNRSLLSTAKHYDHHESRKFLFKTGLYRFFVTLAFCGMMVLTLRGYEGFKKPLVINRTEVRVFNAIMLGLSLGLGLNLASSLKRYAVILRWSLLTKRYVSLEVFDLILGLETLTKVGKLMIISLPGIHKVKFLKKLPWFREARDDGTSKTWIACLLWILVNIGAQVLVASLSLFWPVDPSDALPLLTYGNVTVSDLTQWKVDNTKHWNNSAMEAAWTFGTEASQYPVFPYDQIQRDLSSLAGTPLYKGDSFYEYRFLNRNPDHLYTNYFISSRKVQARASCEQLETKGDYVDEDDDDEPMYVEGRLPGQKGFQKYYLPQITVGSISWIGSTYAYCGPRCTNFTVFQDSDSKSITHNSLFLCNSTLSDVTGGESDFTSLAPEDHEHIYGNDDFARIAAGAMAWTGYVLNDWDDRSTRSYLRGSKWSPYKIITKDEVEDLLSRYTIGAIAAFDDHGLQYTVQHQTTRPVQGQQLAVDWSWILGLLGGICFLQLSALVALVSFANKSIIRDESFFSLAMLLRPVVNRISEGMNMSGEEIKRHPKLLWKRIRYDYREGKEGEPNQVDIFFEGKDMWENRRSWATGLYS